MRRVLLWSAAALLLLVAAAIGAVLLVDLSSYRAVVEAQAEAALGRSVTIAGDLEIKPSMTPTLAVTQVVVANVPGGSREEMARIGRLEIGLELLPLIGGEVRISHIVVIEPDIVLEFGADGVRNWAFDPGGTGADTSEESSGDSAAGGVPFIGRVELRDATISHTALDGRTRGLDIKSADLATTSEDDEVHFEVECVFDGESVRVAATTGPLGALFAGGEIWPIEVAAEIDDSRIAVKGTIDDPLTLAALSVEFDADFASMDAVGRILGQDLSGIPPFKVYGAVTGNLDDELHLKIDVDEDQNRITLDGSITEPAALAAFTLNVDADMASMDGIGRIVGQEMSGIPPFKVHGSVTGNLDDELHLKIDVYEDQNRISLDGSITEPAALAAFAMEVEAEIVSLAPFAGIVGAPLPSVPAFDARGTVSGNLDELHLSGFALTFGESDLAGDLTVALSATPSSITGDLRSERLVVADLLSAAAEHGNGDGKESAETVSADDIDPLTQPLPVDALAAVNIDLGWTVGEIVLSDSTTKDFQVAIRLQDRRLTVSIPGVRLPQGTLTASATLNAREQPPSARLDVATERFNLGGLLRDLQVSDALTIRMDAALNLDSAGETPGALLAGLNGNIVVEADEGDVNARFAGLFGQSLLTAVLPIGDNDTVKIHCAVGHFVIADGVARSTALGVDTQRATIGGDGGADLPARTLDFLFTPQTKDATLVPLVAPVRIHGRITDPQVTVMTKEVLGSVVTSTLLVALVPYAIVLPFIPGISDDPENCQDALYQKLTTPSQSVPGRIVEGATGLAGGAAKGAAGLVGGVVDGVGDAAAGVGGALGNVGRGVGNALGGLFGGGDEPPAPADD